MLSYLHIILVILLLAAVLVVAYYRNKVAAQRKHINNILEDLTRIQEHNKELMKYQKRLKSRGQNYYRVVSEGFPVLAEKTEDKGTLEKIREDIKQDEKLFAPEGKGN